MGFEARNSGLSEKRNQIIGRIEEDLAKDKNVLGLFYGGSIGTDQTDPYSDIDLRVVIKDKSISLSSI
ncbi:nucleotidyltransferase domain-containing protein [Pseudalkalibacillus salsuginis]|uniref:nucleotidyltransferase domain-containing protein n=1 Tax=Pseudalkalibacillus salsuginis TaxID=2910972 RepID=UPI001F1C98A5|nr:nucleotidyltransferase domain-containing protein [Pseudalkalibacillus salsuginis]MCF6409390.1 nucleotidyltransferase domain-containing protein [Pseudalkalibacillus salsuginis]